MNAGIADAFNLAHKLKSQKGLHCYEAERIHANLITKEFAMNNYWKNVKLAEEMWLKKSNLDTYEKAVSSILPSFMQKQLFLAGRDIGLRVAKNVVNHSKIVNYVESNNKNTIRLTFPNLDFGIAYGSKTNDSFLRKHWDEDAFKPFAREIGSLVPHILIDQTAIQ